MGMNTPNPISGFPELLPAQQVAFNKCMAIIRNVYESYGFIPLDTPAVERVETLQAKGGADHEIYGIYRLNAAEGQKAKKDLALRFDLTVPLARFVAQHYGKLTFPFRRYHIAPVWRGERAQAGRYRQFYQCDIDVIGDGTLAPIFDAEMPAIIYEVLTKLNIGRFILRINNRKVLFAILAYFGVESADTEAAVKVIDNLEKIPASQALAEMEVFTPKAADLLAFFAAERTNAQSLQALRDMAIPHASELEELVDAMRALGVPEDAYKLDFAIARGLDYYTGTVYETQLVDFPHLGSICSGGRYENLADNFTRKSLPGVGISIGLSRLIPLMGSGVIPADVVTVAPVLIAVQEREAIPTYLNLARQLRHIGIGVDVYLEEKSLKAQLKYADKQGFSVVIMANANDMAAHQWLVKDMRVGAQETVTDSAVVDHVAQLLG